MYGWMTCLFCSVLHPKVDTWSDIAMKIGNKRTAMECARHYQQTFNAIVKTGAWTEEEEKMLVEVIANHYYPIPPPLLPLTSLSLGGGMSGMDNEILSVLLGLWLVVIRL